MLYELGEELKSKYEDIVEIGEGGFAYVYSMRRKSDGKIVAMKEIKKDNKYLRGIRKTARSFGEDIISLNELVKTVQKKKGLFSRNRINECKEFYKKEDYTGMKEFMNQTLTELEANKHLGAELKPESREQFDKIIKKLMTSEEKYDKQMEHITDLFNETVKSLKKERDFSSRFKEHEDKDKIVEIFECHYPSTPDEAINKSGYLIMEYCDKHSLSDYLEESKLPLEERIRLALDISKAISSIHSMGLIHRDITDKNILVYMKEGKPFIKVADLGLSRVPKKLGDENTNTFVNQEVPGTLKFQDYFLMGKESISISDKDWYAADIYSCGGVLYRLLSNGELPYDFDTDQTPELIKKNPGIVEDKVDKIKTLYDIVKKDSFSEKQISGIKTLSDLVMSMFKKEREKRPKAEEVYKKIRRVYSDFSTVNSEEEIIKCNFNVDPSSLERKEIENKWIYHSEGEKIKIFKRTIKAGEHKSCQIPLENVIRNIELIGDKVLIDYVYKKEYDKKKEVNEINFYVVDYDELSRVEPNNLSGVEKYKIFEKFSEVFNICSENEIALNIKDLEIYKDPRNNEENIVRFGSIDMFEAGLALDPERYMEDRDVLFRSIHYLLDGSRYPSGVNHENWLNLIAQDVERDVANYNDRSSDEKKILLERGKFLKELGGFFENIGNCQKNGLKEEEEENEKNGLKEEEEENENYKIAEQLYQMGANLGSKEANIHLYEMKIKSKGIKNERDFEDIKKGLKIYMNDNMNKGRACLAFGELYMTKSNEEEALKYYEKAFSEGEKDVQEKIIQIYSDNIGKYVSTVESFKKSITLLEKMIEGEQMGKVVMLMRKLAEEFESAHNEEEKKTVNPYRITKKDEKFYLQISSEDKGKKKGELGILGELGKKYNRAAAEVVSNKEKIRYLEKSIRFGCEDKDIKKNLMETKYYELIYKEEVEVKSSDTRVNDECEELLKYYKSVCDKAEKKGEIVHKIGKIYGLLGKRDKMIENLKNAIEFGYKMSLVDLVALHNKKLYSSFSEEEKNMAIELVESEGSKNISDTHWYTKSNEKNYKNIADLALGLYEIVEEDSKIKMLKISYKFGNPEAAYRLGKYEKEQNINDIDEVIEYFEYAAGNGYDEAKYELAKLLIKKEDQNSRNRAYEYMELLAKRRHVGSIFELGKWNFDGIKKEKNVEGASKLFSQVVADDLEGVNNTMKGDAWYYLGLIDEKEGKIEEANKRYKNAKELGNLIAAHKLGMIAKKDNMISEARSHFEYAAAGNYNEAKYELMKLLIKDENESEREKGYEVLKDIRETWDAKLIIESGKWLFSNKGDERDLTEALSLFERIVSKDSKIDDSIKGEAYCYLGLINESNKNNEDARMKYEEGKNLGNLEAVYRLGMLAKKEGKIDEACVYFESAGNEGYDEAKYELAKLLIEKRSQEESDKACKLMELLAEKRHVSSIMELGKWNYHGTKKVKDLRGAVKYFMQIVNDDSQVEGVKNEIKGEAWYYLGLISQELGDYKKVVGSYKNAVSLGSSEAAYVLANLYEKGSRGVSINYEKARFYYREALDGGVDRARVNLIMMLLKGEGTNQKDINKNKEILNYFIGSSEKLRREDIAVNFLKEMLKVAKYYESERVITNCSRKNVEKLCQYLGAFLERSRNFLKESSIKLREEVDSFFELTKDYMGRNEIEFRGAKRQWFHKINEESTAEEVVEFYQAINKFSKIYEDCKMEGEIKIYNAVSRFLKATKDPVMENVIELYQAGRCFFKKNEEGAYVQAQIEVQDVIELYKKSNSLLEVTENSIQENEMKLYKIVNYFLETVEYPAIENAMKVYKELGSFLKVESKEVEDKSMNISEYEVKEKVVFKIAKMYEKGIIETKNSVRAIEYYEYYIDLINHINKIGMEEESTKSVNKLNAIISLIQLHKENAENIKNGNVKIKYDIYELCKMGIKEGDGGYIAPEMAMLHYNGYNFANKKVEQNYWESSTIFLNLSNKKISKEYHDAINNLAKMFYHGEKCHQDKDRACRLFELAKKNGSTDALYELGKIHSCNGDYVKGFNYYKEAAEKGHVGAMNSLINCYELGIGTDRRTLEEVKQICRGFVLKYQDNEHIYILETKLDYLKEEWARIVNEVKNNAFDKKYEVACILEKISKKTGIKKYVEIAKKVYEDCAEIGHPESLYKVGMDSLGHNLSYSIDCFLKSQEYSASKDKLDEIAKEKGDERKLYQIRNAKNPEKKRKLIARWKKAMGLE